MTAGHPMRVAGIDCGTNSIRLLVADVAREPDGRPRLADVHREMRVVRLGEGVDATGRLSSHALDRTWRALADYAAIISTCGAVRTRMVATSATRDAQNRGDFVEMVRSTLGQDPEVITGDQEAELTFAGAVGDLDPATGPFLVVDIGGGSTELVIGERDGSANRLAGGISLDIGCVRITERILRGDPPTPAERDEARWWARRILADGLDRLPVERGPPAGAGVGHRDHGGRGRVEATDLRPGPDPSRPDPGRAGARRGPDAARRHPGTPGRARVHAPGRVDVIGGGALILSTMVDLVAARGADPGGHGVRARHPRRHRAVPGLTGSTLVRQRIAPVAQSAEAGHLKWFQCGFESHRGHASNDGSAPRMPRSSEPPRPTRRPGPFELLARHVGSGIDPEDAPSARRGLVEPGQRHRRGAADERQEADRMTPRTARMLDDMIEEATVDCHDESESVMGLYTMLDEDRPRRSAGCSASKSTRPAST